MMHTHVEVFTGSGYGQSSRLYRFIHPSSVLTGKPGCETFVKQVGLLQGGANWTRIYLGEMDESRGG